MDAPLTDLVSFSVHLLFKAVALAANWAGQRQKRTLDQIAAMPVDEKTKEIIFLRNRVEQLEIQVGILLKRLRDKSKKPRYTIRERLKIIFHMEIFQIPRRSVHKHFGIARSTLYRWMKRIDDAPKANSPMNKTPKEIAELVWQIVRNNPNWGSFRVANQLAFLGVFLAASTVRNILNRPRPKLDDDVTIEFVPDEQLLGSRSVAAFYPNHVWSIDYTLVYRWGLYKTYVLVVIDHFSRKLITAKPLEGPNAGWAIDWLEKIFRRYGPPKHMISDQGSVFTGAAFHDFLDDWNVKIRYGAVGKHGSISVTERVIKSLKYEWLKRVPLIRGFDHLTELCGKFEIWYNGWRPHIYLNGARPDDCYCRDLPEPVARDAKTVPKNIEMKTFKETRIVGYRLDKAA